ncbi:MAG: hypothetical protein DME53_04045 [Verrucomicrobia bacterium]|nr:MAG: hypothetical protein DME53_04045 [Verrucomicrobiota bacterium]
MSSTVETNTSSHHFCCPDLAEGYTHAPIFVASKEVDVKQLVWQTIFLAVLLAVTVNLQPSRK